MTKPQPAGELAPAKINLSLRVLGRRPDGYHELQSLVAFASIGDRLSHAGNEPFGLDISGPFSSAITPAGNLVLKAAEAVAAATPNIKIGRFHLQKNLPVASGIGGGSADAAAALRLLRGATAGTPSNTDWQALAARLGADVPVCLHGTAAWMCGIGEHITRVPSLPTFWLLLVNPGVAISTADIFRGLGAPALTDIPAPPLPPSVATLTQLSDFMAANHNDLTAPASALNPVITDVLAALARLPGAMHARMSGSGATCFALFASESEAHAAQTSLMARHPQWWIKAARTLS
ncbi:MAG: 4-(cytidine 5'-diphospho)-2-C-methyl-D-erythritol kinase [Hyphomicrobiaceae bacterium]